MNRYGNDFRWSNTGRYGREYDQWGARTGYDRDFGFRGSRAGRFYDRDFSGYQPRDFGGQPYNYGGGFNLNNRYDQAQYGRWNRGYDQQFTGRGPRSHEMRDRGSFGPEWIEERVMRQRSYPSPWDEAHPGATRFGLGYGQGRGQFIYK